MSSSGGFVSNLRDLLSADLEGMVQVADDALECRAEAHYGVLLVRVEYDSEAASLRILTRVPTPAGTGAEFLLFCLGLNTQYWDVKIGVDEAGMLVVHSDMDADADIADIAAKLVDRVETSIDLIDDDLMRWLLEHNVGTPLQLERWRSHVSS